MASSPDEQSGTGRVGGESFGQFEQIGLLTAAGPALGGVSAAKVLIDLGLGVSWQLF